MTGGGLRSVRLTGEREDGPIAIVVRPLTAESSAFWTTRSDSLSRADVAARVSAAPRQCYGPSSSNKMRARRMMARAIAMRCF